MSTLRRAFISRQGSDGLAARNSGPIFFLEASPMISRLRHAALKKDRYRHTMLRAQIVALNEFLATIPNVQKVDVADPVQS